jgi:hypothetical protein
MENDMNLTNHAQARMQQRGINITVLEYLDDYGCYLEQGHKGSIVYFDKRAKALLKKELSRREFARIERKLNAYYVVSNEGAVITVGHRTKPIRH